jgi:hypothetical protein
MALIAVSRKEHADLCISSSNTLLQFANRSSLPLYGLEVGRFACDYPLFFLPTGDTYGISMMCSIDPRLGSACITQKGEWKGTYRLAYLRQQPFSALVNSEDDQQCVVCIDDESSMLAEEGEALFDDGEPTEYLNRVAEFVRHLFQAGKQTALAIRAIQDADLIVPWEISVPRSGGETIKVSDKYRIDESKLVDLDDKQWIDLKEAGALPIIYGQLFSQGNLNKLVMTHNSMNALNKTLTKGGSEPDLDFLIGDEEFTLNFDEV